MDDIFLCPDCHAEHVEPHAAGLGHRARCFSCLVLFEAEDERQQRVSISLEIRAAA